MAKSVSTLAFLARFVLGVGLLIATAIYVDHEALRDAIGRIDPFMFWVAAAASGLGTIVLPAIVTKRTLHLRDIDLSQWELIKINLAMRFYVLTLPHAVTVGMRWHRYNRGQGRGWDIAALLLFERATQLLAVAGFAIAFLAISLPTLPTSLHALVPISAGLCAAGLLVFLAFVSRRVFSLVDPLIGWIAGAAPAWVSRWILRSRAAILEYQGLGSNSMGLVLGCTFGWYLCLIGSGYAASVGLGTGLGFVDIGWMRSTIFLLTLLPITVGGIGVREAGFALLFALTGAGYAVGLAFGLVLLAIQLILGLLGLATEAHRIAATRWASRHADH